MSLEDFYKGKRIFLTGHTGFKGTWLSLFLQKLGAEITGYALEPAKDRESLFRLTARSESICSNIGDY